MKIIHQTTTQLVLEQRLVGIWGLGAFTAIVGLLIILGFTAPLYLVGGLCIAFGSVLEYLTPVEICDLDKQKQKLVLIQRRWLKRSLRHYPLSALRQVQVSHASHLGIHFYNISLCLDSGRDLNLTLFPTTDRRKQEKIVQRIEQFLAAGQLPAALS